jgi:hypothetical protein
MPDRSFPRIFSVAEIDALIPELSRRVAVQLALGARIHAGLKHLAGIDGELPRTLHDTYADTQVSRELKRELREMAASYEEGWGDIQALGAVVKDPEVGLLDFYGRIEGRLVWLCWRYGEERIEFYHELDAGFAGRRSLGGADRARMLN